MSDICRDQLVVDACITHRHHQWKPYPTGSDSDLGRIPLWESLLLRVLGLGRRITQEANVTGIPLTFGRGLDCLQLIPACHCANISSDFLQIYQEFSLVIKIKCLIFSSLVGRQRMIDEDWLSEDSWFHVFLVRRHQGGLCVNNTVGRKEDLLVCCWLTPALLSWEALFLPI